MCQIILKPAGFEFDMAKVEMAIRANPHGFTLFYKMGPNYKLERTMSAEEIMVHVKDCPDTSPAIFHARSKTRGDINIENTHPFEMGENGFLWHNGTVFQIDDRSKPDSQVIAEIINDGDINTAKRLLETFTDSRFILLREKDDGHTDMAIVNEDKGRWIDNLWYSKPSLFKNTIPVFVYGTLKKGLGNHSLLYGSLFVSKGKTERPMIMVKRRWAGYPHVLDIQDENSHQIPGEIYMVSDDTLRDLDRLEGYREKDPDFSHYIRIREDIVIAEGQSVSAYIYVASKATMERMENIEKMERIESFDPAQETFIDELFEDIEEKEDEEFFMDQYGNVADKDGVIINDKDEDLPFEDEEEDSGFPETNS